MSLVVFFFPNDLQVDLELHLGPQPDPQLDPRLDLPPADGTDQTAAAVPGLELASARSR